jgi:hypothetical protein
MRDIPVGLQDFTDRYALQRRSAAVADAVCLVQTPHWGVMQRTDPLERFTYYLTSDRPNQKENLKCR